MFKIIDTADGSVIGSTEKPLFIRKKPSTGCYVFTSARSAQGIAFLGTAYNLHGREPLGADKTVMLIEFDAGSEVDNTAATISEMNSAIDDIVVTLLEV